VTGSKPCPEHEEPPAGRTPPAHIERRRPLPGLTEIPRRLSARGRRIALVVVLAFAVGVPVTIAVSDRAARRRDAREATLDAAAARRAARVAAVRQRPHSAALPTADPVSATTAGPLLARLVRAYAGAHPGTPTGPARCRRRRIEPGGRFVTFGCIVLDATSGGGRRSVLGRPFAGRVDLRRRTATFCESIPLAATGGSGSDDSLSSACIGRV